MKMSVVIAQAQTVSFTKASHVQAWGTHIKTAQAHTPPSQTTSEHPERMALSRVPVALRDYVLMNMKALSLTFRLTASAKQLTRMRALEHNKALTRPVLFTKPIKRIIPVSLIVLIANN